MKTYFLQSITNRGIIETILRGTTIINRYGVYKNKLIENMRILSFLLEEYDAKATIAITSKILNQNPDFQEFIGNDRIELSIHGYEHVDYTQLSYDEIKLNLIKSIDIFKSYGIKACGFRAPYLKINNTIIKAISEVGLKYDSSYTVYFDVVPKDVKNYSQVNRLLNLYDKKFNLPKIFEIEGIMEIPVALPDDEILLDRLKFTPDRVAEYWIASIKKSLEVDESVYVLQIHPERVLILKDALSKVLKWAIDNNIKVKKLSEINEFGTKPGNHYIAITGDIDIIRLGDIIRG